MMLLLRWSWRDLRAHWAKVLAIAVVIGIGTGGYAGLTSTAEWRRVSYDVSYRQLAMYDLRVDLATGSTAPESALAAVLADIASQEDVVAAEERLIFPTQVDASFGDETILVRGQVTGADFREGGPQVNAFHAFTGRALTAADAGEPVVMVERSFALFYGLPGTGELAISGDRELAYVGQVTTPEYFAVAPEGEMFMSEATYAAIFTTLETAQEVAGLPSRVNNLVLTITDTADRDAIQQELEAALARAGLGATVATRDDNLSYSALTTDVDQDQAMFNVLAFLLFAGAVGAAFNLIHRLAEQQRREIGIGMAIGVRPRVLAIRPLLVSVQIAVLGVIFGVVIGTLIGNAMAAVFQSIVPLPVWETPFQTGVFAGVAVVGLLVPFGASAIPVWRAVRVAPIAAIKPTHLVAKEAASPKARHATTNTFRAMPLRNLRRAPRRTVLTILGIAAAMTVLVGFLGIMDSVFDAVDVAEVEANGTRPDRIAVTLDGFYPIGSPAVQAIEDAASVAEVEPVLRVVASVDRGGDDIDVIVELADLDGGMWAPSVSAGALTDELGVLLSEKAAADLGVTVGDTVTFHHPRRTGLTSYAFVDSEIVVVALHPNPVRGFLYMDIGSSGLFGLEGLANGLNVLPTPGATTEAVQQELFDVDSAASVQSVTAVMEAVRNAFDQMLGIIQVMVVAILLLALLIAFNTAAINLDARARDHATMFAFGVKVRTALRIAMTESFAVGVIATAMGAAGGAALVWWMTQVLLPETLPDFQLHVVLKPSTAAAVLVMGIVATAAAPLFTYRRMRRMDVPGTLRLME